MTGYLRRSLSKRPRHDEEDADRASEAAADHDQRDADPEQLDAAQDRYEATLGWGRDQA